MADRLTLDELLETVTVVDANIDASAAPAYRAQPLAADWARVTKVCEEAGEVWRALSKWTGENPRKGVCGTRDDLLGELGDTVSAAMCAIQHLTKDTAETWAVVSAALIKARQRIAEYAPPVDMGYLSLPAEVQADISAQLLGVPGASTNPTPDCGGPRKPSGSTECWWCDTHREFHGPAGLQEAIEEAGQDA
jgi:NTP pyrophosphatase (non-canonical NTP hydrolase)